MKKSKFICVWCAPIGMVFKNHETYGKCPYCGKSTYLLEFMPVKSKPKKARKKAKPINHSPLCAALDKKNCNCVRTR